jgi:hypothetical protein
MTSEEIIDIEELTKAIRNLIRYSNLLLLSSFNSAECLSVFCSILKQTQNTQLKQSCKSLRTLIFAMLSKFQDIDKHRY